MARPAIRAQLTVALRRSIKEHATPELRSLRIEDNSKHLLDITVEALRQAAIEVLQPKLDELTLAQSDMQRPVRTIARWIPCSRRRVNASCNANASDCRHRPCGR